jgi:glycosyltransferase involved in cell wall biosynthesis
VTIWYDVSGLVDWRRPHLGGIERTTAGILDGLHRLGVPVRLVQFRLGGEAFEPVAEGELPVAVRGMCPWLEPPAHRPEPPVDNGAEAADPEDDTAATVADAAEPPAGITGSTPLKALRRKVIYGSGDDAEAFRAAWGAFRSAGRVLVQHAGHRLGVARRPHDAAAAASSPAEEAPPVTPPAVPPPQVNFRPGDVLLSLGGTFATPGHPSAVEGARGQGATIVRMVYDLVPVTKPQWLAPRTVEVAWMRDVATRSDVVLAISECTRREFADYCREAGLTLPRTVVVRPGDVVPGAAPADEPPPLPRFVPRRPFFLCVSTLNVRKNHRCLYDAWSVLAADREEACPDLVCTGMPHDHVGELVHEIRHDRAVNRHVHLLDGIRDAELDWYYRHCVTTIYPSKHEGWGLPIAESLGYGKLCLASSAASMPEISDLPEFFAAHDTPRLVELVARAIDDPAWLADHEARIRRTFRPTTWTDTAAAVLAAVGIGSGAAGAVPNDPAPTPRTTTRRMAWH